MNSKLSILRKRKFYTVGQLVRMKGQKKAAYMPIGLQEVLSKTYWNIFLLFV